MTRAALAVSMFVAVAGCASAPPPAPGPRACRPGPALDDAGCVGWLYDALVVERLGRYDDLALERYVARVGARVARQSGRRDVRWTFRVLDEPGIQAWAAPGGYVYVTRGLLPYLGSEAELAAVLAHEVAHVAAGHTDRLARHLPATTAGRLDDLALTFELGRDEERQADQLAVGYLRRSGYDAGAMITMLEGVHRAANAPDRGSDESWADRHPPLPVRLALASRTADGWTRGRHGRDRYLGRLRGLVLGEDPRRGHVLGRRWYDPSAGLSLEAPLGWTFDVASVGQVETRWARAASPDGRLHLAIAPMAEGSLLGRALADSLGEAPRTSTVAGRPARSAVLEDGRGRLLMIAGADGEARAVMVSGGVPEEVAAALAAIVASARPERVDRVRPTRLRVERAERDTTIARFAVEVCGRGAVEVARLNQRARAATVRAGERIKCPRGGEAPPD